MGTSTIAPSRIARRAAADQWPDVQSQRKIEKGVYWFDCAGHGGVVAVIGEAAIPERAIELARKHQKTEYVGDWHGRLITRERYTRETFEWMRNAGMRVWEVWVGEEDCDWALVALACPAVESRQDRVRGCAERWNPEFLADWDSPS